MKRRRLIILASFILIALAGFVFCNMGSSSRPVLAFIAYGRSETSSAQFAKLKLKNTTDTPIWLFWSGEAGSPLNPGFLEKPMTVPHNATNGVETNSSRFYSLRAGSFFMHGQGLLPGENLELDLPLVSGKPPEQVGISYYAGNFKDDNDFFNNMVTQLQPDSASLKDRIRYWWQKSKRLFKTRKHYEVWCPQALSFQTEKPSPTNAPAP